jgi:hypothetical protein
LRGSFAYVKLCAHFLDLRCLLFHSPTEGCDLFLRAAIRD